MPPLEDAILLALQGHRGQVDKAGKPYILHVLRVMLSLESDLEKMVGVLHDVVEDTAYTLDRLREMGYPEEVLRAIDCLTKREGEPYERFINRVKTNPVARRVKIADLKDNLDIKRLPVLSNEDLERIRKYRSALSELEDNS